MYIFCTTFTLRSRSLRGAFPLHFTYSNTGRNTDAAYAVPVWSSRIFQLGSQRLLLCFEKRGDASRDFGEGDSELREEDLPTYSKYSERERERDRGG